MQIKKIIGFVSPVGKKSQNIKLDDLYGQVIKSNTKIFNLIEEIILKSNDECDIKIKFTALGNNQDNDVRDEIIKIVKDFKVDTCKPLVRNLSYITDNNIKEGLLFFVLAEHNNYNRFLIARFPGETGITKKVTNGKLEFDVTDDIFLKNSRRYKAVYYDSKDQYWVGFAVDKQVNDRSGKIKEISEYWIRDFLKSELSMSSKRGSKILATAIRRTITETNDDEIKKELIGVSTTIKNLNGSKLSISDTLDKLNLSNKTKDEVKIKMSDAKMNKIAFILDISEFNNSFNYLVNILDNGAVVMGPADKFDDLWLKQDQANGNTLYSTEGSPIQEKISNVRI